MKKLILLLFLSVLVFSCEKDEVPFYSTDQVVDIRKPMPKIDICHYDAEYGIWETLSINENALEAHLNHGDVVYPEWLIGSWAGSAYQQGYGYWPIELSLSCGEINIHYPSFGCGGYWEFEDATGNSFTFKEYITYGGGCLSGCTNVISLNADGNLDFVVLPCYGATASGELVKVL